MATTNKVQQALTSLSNAYQQASGYLSGAVGRIFGPNDDKYPETGIQPFEGEPTSKKGKHSQPW